MYLVQEYIKDRWYGIQVFLDRADADAFMLRLGGNLRIQEL